MAAAKHAIHVRDAEFAGGSPWTQVEAINHHLRPQDRPDAILVMPAGALPMKAAVERVIKCGIPVVLLNRVPDWFGDLSSSQSASAFLAAVAPNQTASGRIQGEQALRLAPAGARVLLVTGTVSSATATQRRKGFMEVVQQRYVLHEVDGRWSAPGAEEAVAGWFRSGAGRERQPQLVVCHNDAMAAGARTALLRQAAAADSATLPHVPLVGCDGLAEEGRARIRRGELTATVVLPPTTPPALELLDRYWRSRERAGLVQLEVKSFPALESLRSV